MAKRNMITVDVELTDQQLIGGVAEACVDRGTDVVLSLLLAEVATIKMDQAVEGSSGLDLH